MKNHLFHPSIVRDYDIRGIVGETLFLEDAEALGRSIGSVIRNENKTSVCVARDGRLTSPELTKALIKGLLSTGVNVLNVGVGPSPMLYHAVHDKNAGGGVMVTGSHNPPDYNGFKIMIGGHSLSGQHIQNLADIAKEGKWTTGDGTERFIEHQTCYIQYILKNNSSNALKVAWDTGNGAAGECVKALTPHLGGKHYTLNAEIDGTFPNHHPDPTLEENLVQLKSFIQDKGCDLGFAFDGDGDRLVVVDRDGSTISSDHLIAFFAEHILKTKPKSVILSDVKISQKTLDVIKEKGGVPIIWKTGHSYFKDKMIELNAPFAGEVSGHYYFLEEESYGFDDALLAATLLLKMLTNANQTLEMFVQHFPKTYTTPEIRLACPDDVKFNIINHIIADLKFEGADFIDVDGARVMEKDGWWLIRASNTQPALVARVEANSQENLKGLIKALQARLKVFDIMLPV